MDKSIHTREYAVLLRLLGEARARAGLTQTALAAALGQSQSFVSKVEVGERRLDVIQLRTILDALGVTLPDFVRDLERGIAADADATG